MNQEKRKAMHRVQAAYFAMTEAGLFLDANPDSCAAQDYFDQQRVLYRHAAADYEREYGPLNCLCDCDKSRHLWVSTPWPWEYEFC